MLNHVLFLYRLACTRVCPVRRITLAVRTPNVVPNVMVIAIAQPVVQHVSMAFARIHAMVPVVLVPIVICVD